MLRTAVLISATLLATAACSSSRASTAPPTQTSSSTQPTSSASTSATPQQPTSLTIQGHRATYVGPMKATQHFAKPGVTLAPPVGALDSLDWQRAYRSCFSGAVQCVPSGDATVTLASATGPAGFPSPSGNLFDQTDVFLITFSKTSCFALQAASCRTVYLVPIKTYQNTYGFEIDGSAQIPGT